MIEKLNKAIEFRNKKNYRESETILKELLIDYPNSPQVYYHYAWLCDNMGREIEACPKYEKAIALGLSEVDLKDCYLGLGSTYRSIGEYQKSIEIFDKAINRFPIQNEYKVFKAMTLYNLKNYKEAMNLLLNVIAETSSDENIKVYKKAIIYYAEGL